jgi:hypothetical protein
MNARRLAVLLVAAVALAAAGCGGGGSDEASGDTDTAAVETMTTETTAGDTATTDETMTERSGEDTGSTDLGELSGKCAELAGLGSKLAAAMGGQNGEVEDVSKLFDDLADQVPEEIRADWQVLARNFQKIADALKGVDLSSGETPSAEVLAKLQKLSSTFDSQEMQQAATHIDAWSQEIL